MFTQIVPNIPVGKTVRIEELNVTLEAVPSKSKNPCASCFFACVSARRCKEYRAKVVGECISWKREDNERIVFRSL